DIPNGRHRTTVNGAHRKQNKQNNHEGVSFWQPNERLKFLRRGAPSVTRLSHSLKRSPVHPVMFKSVTCTRRKTRKGRSSMASEVFRRVLSTARLAIVARAVGCRYGAF